MRVVEVTTAEQLADAMEVRFEVFVGEQGVSPEGERDSLDDDPRTHRPFRASSRRRSAS